VCNFSLRKLAFLLLFLSITQPLYAGGNIYCWVNEDNVKECANYIPQKYSQQGFVEYDRNGNKINTVNPALTSEEIAVIKREQLERIQRQEQRKKDEKLLEIFSSESDIEESRKSEITTIDAQIQSIKSILGGLKRNLNALQESYKLSKNHPAVSKRQLRAIQLNIDSVKKRIADTEDTLKKMFEERVKTNKKYDVYVEHYEEIQQRRRQERFSLIPK
jgi:chromosome segregation ATPase